MECEIMQVITEEAMNSYREEIIQIMTNNSVEQLEENVLKIRQMIEDGGILIK
jgi:broad-specificity NMP kinase